MKQFATILFFTLATLTINAQELTWHTNMDKASEIALKNKKPLMLFFTGSDWCGWCIKLQKEVFNTSEFVIWANENVILVELDFPRRKQISPELKSQNQKFEQMLSVQGYPTVWFITPEITNGKITFNALGSTGYVANGPQAWIPSAKQILTSK